MDEKSSCDLELCKLNDLSLTFLWLTASVGGRKLVVELTISHSIGFLEQRKHGRFRTHDCINNRVSSNGRVGVSHVVRSNMFLSTRASGKLIPSVISACLLPA